MGGCLGRRTGSGGDCVRDGAELRAEVRGAGVRAWERRKGRHEEPRHGPRDESRRGREGGARGRELIREAPRRLRGSSPTGPCDQRASTVETRNVTDVAGDSASGIK